ncbi:hypothetical protein J6590_057527 [Homalodisca vitripennis]|nr:hypothetical protein J6590_057527 [Homalodisca vitripennis]
MHTRRPSTRKLNAIYGLCTCLDYGNVVLITGAPVECDNRKTFSHSYLRYQSYLTNTESIVNNDVAERTVVD